jgi:serine/threonine protein kinase
MKSLKLPQGEWSYADGAPLGQRGGFAAVYPGLDLSGQHVAVKVFHSSDPRIAQRELEFAADRFEKLLEHVTPILGFGIDPSIGRACIVMAKAEYSLAQKLEMDGPFPEPAAVAIAHAIVKGLRSIAWVHRDLKPANVLWVESRWQLTDFGIARQADAKTATSTMKRFQSHPYAAPEQWNDERATHWTDVYALGCLLYELVSGSPPFPGPSETEYAMQHRSQAPMITVGSARLKTLLLWMLNKSADTRPLLEELDHRLANWSESEPSGSGRSPLADAAAHVAQDQARERAAEATQRHQGSQRTTIEEDALRELDSLSKELFDRIRADAPNATFSDRRKGQYPMRSAQLGMGSLVFSIGEFRGLTQGLFAASGWDVVCGDFIKVGQAGGGGRSASLWFVRRDEAPFEWIEVSYFEMWTNRRSQEPSPRYLQPGRDADLAASKGMHSWSFAHPPRSLRGDGRNTFIERWLGYLALVSMGRLHRPSTLPELQ